MSDNRNNELARLKFSEDSRQLAIEAAQYVVKYIRQSATHPSTHIGEFSQINAVCDKVRQSHFSEDQSVRDLYTLPDVHFDRSLHRIKHAVKTVKKAASEDQDGRTIGNCQECSFLALNYLRKGANKLARNNPDFGENWCAEVIAIVGGDHFFLLINRSPGSDITLPASWGENAYICDSWTIASPEKSRVENAESCVYRVVDDYDPVQKKFTRLRCYNYEAGENHFSPYDFKKHTFSSFYKIGGSDALRKMHNLLVAKSYLDLIRNALLSLADMFPNVPEFRKIALETMKDIHNIDRARIEKSSDANLDVELQRELSRVIRKRIKDAQQIPDQSRYSKRLLNECLVAAWISNLKNEALVTWAVFWHIFTTHANNVTLPALKICDDTVFNEQIKISSYWGYNLLGLAAVRGDEKYFSALFAKVETDTLINLVFGRLNGATVVSKKTLLVLVLEKLGLEYFGKIVGKVTSGAQGPIRLESAFQRLYSYCDFAIDAITTTDLFFYALQINNFAAAKVLLSYPMDMNRKNQLGENPAAAAISKNQPSFFRNFKSAPQPAQVAIAPAVNPINRKSSPGKFFNQLWKKISTKKDSDNKNKTSNIRKIK